MNIGLCDDDGAELERLRMLVADYGRIHAQAFCIQCFRSGPEILAAIAAGTAFDIIFLDIYMEGADGIAVAKEIRKQDKTCAIIFETSSLERAIDGYGVRALQYLVKPLSSGKVAEALDLALETQSPKPVKSVQIQNRQGVFMIPLEDIVFAESNARIVTIHLRNQENASFYGRLDDFEKQCGDRRFLRCHKSFLVNLDRVHTIVNNRVLLETGSEIRFSMNITEVKEAFAAHIAGKI